MPQTTELMHTLKKLLKRHNKTYVDVATCLDLSEASVKRLFSEQKSFATTLRCDLRLNGTRDFRFSARNEGGTLPTD